MFSKFIKYQVQSKRSLFNLHRNFGTVKKELPLASYLNDFQSYNDTDGFVLKSPYGSMNSPQISIDKYIWKNMSRWKDHVAIECGLTGRKYTYSKLRDHCAAMAIRLRTKLQLENNDVVGICLSNCPEYAIPVLGGIEAGLIVTTINPNFTAEEISRQLISSRPKVIFGSTKNSEIIKRACALAQLDNVKIIAIKMDSSESLPSNAIDFYELIQTDGLNLSESSAFNDNTDLDKMVLLPYSSGTTGFPKGVMLSHNNITGNCEAMNTDLPYEKLILPTTGDHQDVLPCVLPFYHGYALIIIMFSKLALGCKLVSMPKYDINTFVRVIGNSRATYLCVVPPMVIQMANLEKVNRKDFQTIRHVMSAASTLALTDAERFRERVVDANFLQGYGLTETSPLCTISPIGCSDYGAVGWTVAGIEAKIVDVENENSSRGLNANESGELWFRGHNVMKGYFKNEEATKAMITTDGWLKTGDIGHYDRFGLFHVSDRIKELIKVNANQVAPAELEAILREHKDVLDAVVIGVPNAITGEVPRAFVVKRTGSNVTDEDLKEFVAKQVVRYKQITGGIYFVDSIPKTATGKILRRDVRAIKV